MSISSLPNDVRTCIKGYLQSKAKILSLRSLQTSLHHHHHEHSAQ